MAFQEAIYSDTTLSDFSAALLRANKDQNSHFRGDKSVDISLNDYASPANRNLSSLLSQIQDDGPANTDQVKRDSFFNRTRNNNKNAPYAKQGAVLNGDNILPVSSSKLPQGRRSRDDDTRDNKSRSVKTRAGISEAITTIGSWVLVLLVLSVAVLSALTMFKLDSRTSELEESLNSYDASLQDSLMSQSENENLSLSITNTKETLQSLQQQLQHIKTDYEVLDAKYAESMAGRGPTQTNKALSTQDSVGDLKNAILALKSELQTVKKKLLTTHKDKPSKDKTNKENKVINKSVASNGLTVTLASLTNKTKVEKVAEQLQDAGMFPLIQQAVVKGNRVYRLSVSGFLNRDEAESFIRKAGKQYGLKDGWISKS